MITLQGMAEHRFSNVYNYQCLTKVLYLFMWILTFPLIPFPSYFVSSFISTNLFFYKKKKEKLANLPSLHFYGMIFWWKKGSLHRNSMAAIPLLSKKVGACEGFFLGSFYDLICKLLFQKKL